jgi:hypothetical protein
MLLHIDGSRHQWFQDERWYDLIVILDDATSEIYYAQLVEGVDVDGDGRAARRADLYLRYAILCALQDGPNGSLGFSYGPPSGVLVSARRSKALTTEGTEDHRGNRQLIGNVSFRHKH